MRKLTQLLAGTFIIVLGLTGCKDDETDSNLPLAGTTWTLSTITSVGCTDQLNNGVETCTSTCDTVVFNANGILSVTEDGVQVPATIMYTVAGNVITVMYEDSGIPVTEIATYTIVNNKLTIQFGADVDDGCINTEVYTGV